MKILQIPFCYYPDAVGGTEVYVESLAHHLRQSGMVVVIAAPGKESSAYEHRGLRIRRFQVASKIELRELYGQGDTTAAREFASILEEERPDVVHLHAFTSGASLRIVREARRRGIRVVFTYHTPSVSCQRGTLLRWGTGICDGEVKPHICAACALQSQGMNRIASLVLAQTPKQVENFIEATGLSGKHWTALRMRGLLEFRQSAFYRLIEEVDSVVALCEWSRELLLRNGVNANKLAVSAHGLCDDYDGMLLKKPLKQESQSLRLAFLGRLDPIKGADVLIRALRSLTTARVELDLYHATSSGPDSDYLHQLETLAAGDSRIRFLPAVSHQRVIELLRNYDLLAVPSRCLETGPLVVLEAFAAGIPVIGSNLGGIAELVGHELNGVLVEVDSVKAWSAAISRLNNDRMQIERLRLGIRPPRRMKAVAQEMLNLYQQFSPVLESRMAVARG